MGVPFGLASYAYALLSRTGDIPDRPYWKGVFILAAGMPVSLAVGAVIGLLSVAVETGIMHIAGFGAEDLPFDTLRVLISEGASCFAWGACLLIWSRQLGYRLSRNYFLALVATLFVGILITQGLSMLIFRDFHKDIYFLLTSVIETGLSAFLVILCLAKIPSGRKCRDPQTRTLLRELCLAKIPSG
jgi:hypothetical protein